MTCPRCRAEHAPSSKFCPHCGQRLARLCPRCGAPSLGEHRFCGDCGATLAPEPPADRFTHPERYTPKHLKDAILNSKSALEGERKQVTVLLTDLKSSLELLDRFRAYLSEDLELDYVPVRAVRVDAHVEQEETWAGEGEITFGEDVGPLLGPAPDATDALVIVHE